MGCIDWTGPTTKLGRAPSFTSATRSCFRSCAGLGSTCSTSASCTRPRARSTIPTTSTSPPSGPGNGRRRRSGGPRRAGDAPVPRLRRAKDDPGLSRRASPTPRPHPAAAPPRVDAAVQDARDRVEADAQELALGVAQLNLGASHEDDRAAARDQPADPRADRPVDADAVAASDVPAVVVVFDWYGDH